MLGGLQEATSASFEHLMVEDVTARRVDPSVVRRIPHKATCLETNHQQADSKQNGVGGNTEGGGRFLGVTALND
jgi:hypothetical protein